MRAVSLAERATLGALLTIPTIDGGDTGAAGRDPARDATRKAVIGWLRPEDFADPWHAEVYRTIRALGCAGDPSGPQAVGLDMLRRHGATRADVVRVGGLVHDLPPHARSDTYAVMVLEASLRRQIAAQGVLLRAGALQAGLDNSARPMNVITALVEDTLDRAADRWAIANGQERSDRGGRAPVPLRSATAGVGGSLGADRLLAVHPSPTTRQVADHEATLIAALITHPAQIGATSAWLRPAAVTNRTWRPVYEALLRLHTYARPLDVVTVCWETQRAARTAGPGPDPRDAMALVERCGTVQPAYASRQVAADHLRLAADRAAESLYASSANPGLDLTDVLGTGLILTEALRAGARPLDPASDQTRVGTVHALPAPHAHRAGPVAG